jgi:hypothetical protein
MEVRECNLPGGWSAEGLVHYTDDGRIWWEVAVRAPGMSAVAVESKGGRALSVPLAKQAADRRLRSVVGRFRR